jgi:hypothetical protein
VFLALWTSHSFDFSAAVFEKVRRSQTHIVLAVGFVRVDTCRRLFWNLVNPFLGLLRYPRELKTHSRVHCLWESGNRLIAGWRCRVG